MPPTWSQEVDDLFTTTWSYRKGPAIAQSFLSNPFIFWLKEKGRTMPVSGHRRIEVPVEYGSNETIRWIGKGGTVPINDNALVTMAYEDWKYIAISIMRFGTDDQKNKGSARMINYLETKLQAAERAIWENLESTVNSDGTGADEPNGLKNLIENTAEASQTTTVHGLSRSTYSWWRNQRSAATGTASVYLLSDMRTALNDCSKYDRVGLKDYVILCDQTSYETYEDEVLEQKQIVNQTLGDAGFETISFKGRPLIWSPSAESNVMRFVNTNYIKFVYDEGYYFEMTDWKSIPNQVNDKVAQIVSACNFIVTRPITMKVQVVSP